MLLIATCLLLSAAPTNPTLARAIKTGDLKVVQSALDAATPVETRLEKKHSTLLGLAARSGQVEVVKLLLSRGALTTALNDDRETPILEAMSQPEAKAVELVKVLKGPLEQGPETPLMNAASRGRGELVKALLALGANPATQEEIGTTALHRAIRSRNTVAVEALLATKKGLELADKYGQTPLLVAADMHEAPMLRLLIAAGARVNVSDSTGSVLAKVADDLAMVELVLAKGADVKKDGTAALCEAVEANQPQVIKRLLAAGAQLEPAKTLTPLMVASRVGNIDLVKVLLESTKQVDTQDAQGRTALHWATERNFNADLMKLLLAAGADPKKKDAGGQTARQLAEGLGNLDLVKVLVEKEGGSPIDVSKGSWAVVFGGGKTPADAAKWSGWLDTEKSLWSQQLVFGDGFPRVMKSDDVAGMNPGFHIVVLGFCGADQLGDVMKTFKGSAERVYARKVTEVPAGALCPEVLLKNREFSDVWSDEGGNRLHVAVFPRGNTSDLFATLRSPEGALLDTKTESLAGPSDYARLPAARVGVASFTDRDASCGALTEVQLSVTSRNGKVVIESGRGGSATPYCD